MIFSFILIPLVYSLPLPPVSSILFLGNSNTGTISFSNNCFNFNHVPIGIPLLQVLFFCINWQTQCYLHYFLHHVGFGVSDYFAKYLKLELGAYYLARPSLSSQLIILTCLWMMGNICSIFRYDIVFAALKLYQSSSWSRCWFLFCLNLWSWS